MVRAFPRGAAETTILVKKIADLLPAPQVPQACSQIIALVCVAVCV